jgi:hypothetical protein
MSMKNSCVPGEEITAARPSLWAIFRVAKYPGVRTATLVEIGRVIWNTESLPFRSGIWRDYRVEWVRGGGASLVSEKSDTSQNPRAVRRRK